MDTEFTDTVLNNAFEMWFVPEIERRKQTGIIPQDFHVWAAQVIFDLDHEPVINFNEDLQGVIQTESLREVRKGQVLEENDIGKILGFALTDQAPNAAHLTTIRHKGLWHLFFDFRYNATRIKENLTITQQFLEAAETALGKQHINAFVENLFASVELMAKCYLMIHPDRRVLESKKHSFTATQFNLQRKHENVPSEFVELLNYLSELRPKARYGGGESLGLDADEARDLHEQAQRMAQYVDEITPKRVES